MLTTQQRAQIPPILALIALVLAALSLQLIGMTFGAALACGGMLGAGLAAAVWGMSASGTPAPLRIRWLLWPHAAAVITLSWLAALRLLPQPLLSLSFSAAALDVALLGTVTFFAELWLRGRRLGRAPMSIALPAALAAGEAILRGLSPHHGMEIGELITALASMGLAFLLADVFCALPARGANAAGSRGLALGG